VERLLVDMWPLIDHDRFEVDVAYVLPWKDAYRHELADAGADVRCLGSSRPGDPRWVLSLGRLIRERSYDLIHTHAPVPAVAARMVTMGRSAPALVHTEHNMWDRYRRPTRWLNSATYHRNAVVVAVSDHVAGTIAPVWPSRAPEVRTVHHGTVPGSVRSYDRSERRSRREQLGLPASHPVIGNVGSFTAKKDHGVLLRALAGARSDSALARARLVLIGSGPLESELRAEVDRLGLDHRVVFLGSRDDVFDLLPLLDVFCLSSRFEGFPIALVEAMATGLVCVATTVGGIPEILVDGENGRLVPPGDPAALGRVLDEVVADVVAGGDEAIRMGRRAAETAEKLDLRSSVDQLQQLYRLALERAGRGQ
jgi:glycosyltransferase involved in cell wall biosynthesis